jgi:threonine synthase
MPEIRCEDWGCLFPENYLIHCCENCGGYFDFADLPEFDTGAYTPELPGIWKYRSSFSLRNPELVVTLERGNTPFIWDDPTTHEIGFKLESLNPTGSYKDRGSAVLVSQLLARNVFLRWKIPVESWSIICRVLRQGWDCCQSLCSRAGRWP